MRRLGRLMVVAAAVGVLALTLFPAGKSATPGPFECFICGERGLADVILNVILFMPLGMSLAVVRPAARAWNLLVVAALLSLMVESAQLFIPGRDASVGDLLFNTIGAALGVLITAFRATILHPAGARAAVAATAGSLALILLTGLLLEPQLPDSRYAVLWAPELDHLDIYRGEVRSASIGARTLLRNERIDAEAMRPLMDGDELRVTASATARMPNRTAPILTLYDESQREVVLLGLDGRDMVFRVRLASSRLRLDQPDFRWRGRSAYLAADSVLALGVRRDGDRFILRHGSTNHSSGHTLGSTWGLLLYIEQFPPALVGALDLLWVFLIALPPAFWAITRRAQAIASGILLAGFVIIPHVTALQAPGALDWIGLAAGLSAGVTLRGMIAQNSMRPFL